MTSLPPGSREEGEAQIAGTLEQYAAYGVDDGGL